MLVSECACVRVCVCVRQIRGDEGVVITVEFVEHPFFILIPFTATAFVPYWSCGGCRPRQFCCFVSITTHFIADSTQQCPVLFSPE